MGRKSLKESRQKEIIKAFYKVGKKEGLENASIAKTAATIDVNPSLVMHYFKTKEQLIYGLVEYILDKYLLIFTVPTKSRNKPKEKLLIVINNIFSNKWNLLFDDSLSYSCYSLSFRDKIIKQKYKALLEALRQNLKLIIEECNNAGVMDVKDSAHTADLIFVLVDGAYYYLSLTNDKKEYSKKLNKYKTFAIELLQLNKETTSSRSLRKLKPKQSIPR